MWTLCYLKYIGKKTIHTVYSHVMYTAMGGERIPTPTLSEWNGRSETVKKSKVRN